MRKQKTILFILVFITGIFFAQKDTAFCLRGRVIDQVTGKSIPNALIKICGCYRSSYANSSGDFNIILKKRDEIFQIDAPGYFASCYSTPMLVKPEMVFALQPIADKNEPTKIATETVFRNGKWRPNKFTFRDNLTIILASDLSSGRDAIISINDKNDIISNIPVSDKLTGFTETADGSFVVLGEKKAFIYKFKNSFVNLTELEIFEFEKKHYSSQFRDSSGKYLRYQSGYSYFISPNMSIMARRTYLTYHIRMKKNNRLALFKNFSDEAFLNSSGNWKNSEQFSGTKFLYSNGKIIFHEVPWEIFQDKERLIFVDTENSKAETFDTTGRLIKTISFKTGLGGYLHQKIIFDKYKSKFYRLTLLSNSNSNTRKHYTSLSQVDFNTGSSIEPSEYSAHIYASAEIKNGMLYYIKNENGLYYIARFRVD